MTIFFPWLPDIAAVDPEKEPERFQDYKLKRLEWAYKTFVHWKQEFDQGKLRDPDWDKHIEDRWQEALEKGEPEEFCWTLLLVMGLGGPDCPLEEREGYAADCMSQWANYAAATGILRSGRARAGESAPASA